MSAEQPQQLDHKLVQQLSGRRIPSWAQLKQVSRVLSVRERKTIAAAIVVIIGCVVGLGIYFYLTAFDRLPAPGGEYSEALIGAPQYLNPLLAQTNDVDLDITRLVFSGLVKFDRNLEIAPDLADHWEISDDKKTYTFYLRPNAKWHDGEPVTADDVVFTINSIQDPDFHSPLLISLRGVSVEKIDDLVVKFTLPEVYPVFLDVLTLGLLPEHIWSDVQPANAALTQYNLEPIGSGPWKLNRYVKDKLGNIRSYTLVPSENYYSQKPYLEKITFRFYPDFESAIDALKNHTVNGISFLPKEFEALRGEKNLVTHGLSLPQYTSLFFNQQRATILQDKAIRLALAQAIDRQKIVSDALQLQGQTIDGPILPMPIQPTDPAVVPSYNPEQANQALDKAGWATITADEYRGWLTSQTGTSTSSTTPMIELDSNQASYRKKGNQILEITLTTIRQPENIKVAEMIESFWQAVGVKVTVQIVDPSKMSREIIKPRNYQVLLFGVVVGSDADPFPFWHSSQINDPGLNLALYGNRQTDKVLEDARSATTDDGRKASYQKFYDMVLGDVPAVFLYNPVYTYVNDRRVNGFAVDRMLIPADRFNNLTEWYIKTILRYRNGK